MVKRCGEHRDSTGTTLSGEMVAVSGTAQGTGLPRLQQSVQTTAERRTATVLTHLPCPSLSHIPLRSRCLRCRRTSAPHCQFILQCQWLPSLPPHNGRCRELCPRTPKASHPKLPCTRQLCSKPRGNGWPRVLAHPCLGTHHAQSCSMDTVQCLLSTLHGIHMVRRAPCPWHGPAHLRSWPCWRQRSTT